MQPGHRAARLTPVTNLPKISSNSGRLTEIDTLRAERAFTKQFLKFSELVRGGPKQAQEVGLGEWPTARPVPIREDTKVPQALGGPPGLVEVPEKLPIDPPDGGDGRVDEDAPREDEEPPIDPLALSLSSPVLLSAGAPPQAEPPHGAAPLDPMLQEILQAVAWGGD